MRALSGVIVPPLCAACARRGCRGGALLCPGCRRLLAGAEPLTGRGPSGIDRAWSSAPHQGVARDLVASLKFRRLLPLAGLMAERIEALAPAWVLDGEIVPVPTAPLRSLLRGFDPAEEIAAELAARCGLALRRGCLARRGAGRQVGRRRGSRLGDPPRVGAVGAAPRSVVLLDDVMTTGATLSACARALRGAGARRVVAVTFSRSP
jgi:predicted amidophosphoribosyltransferase